MERSSGSHRRANVLGEERVERLGYEATAPGPEPRPLGRGDAVLALLTVGTTALAGLLLWRGLTTWLEALRFVTGAFYLWLTNLTGACNFSIVLLHVAMLA